MKNDSNYGKDKFNFENTKLTIHLKNFKEVEKI